MSPSEASQEYRLPPRRSIDYRDGTVIFLDQTELPDNERVIVTDDWRAIADGIRSLALRGAPLIGVAAGLAVAAFARSRHTVGKGDVYQVIIELKATRPTAYNLFWALDQVRDAVAGCDAANIAETIERTALAIMEDDRRRCELIGEAGQRVVPNAARILTVCNTGWLATAGIGTALAVIYRAADAGKNISVHSVETRPLLQGARLTVWELIQAGIPVTMMVDSAAAGLCAAGMIDMCIIGADRIAANGDTANKIGSYQLALACRAHSIPYYVAAPFSTIDPDCPDGGSIPIEQRASSEVTTFAGRSIAPAGAQVYNPAFDVVPAHLISGIITERGIITPPFRFTNG